MNFSQYEAESTVEVINQKPEAKSEARHDSGSFFPNITRPVQVGRVTIGGPAFTVIAGPCAIESHSLFMETAQAVKENGASLLRGGVWKLRTSADTFQGLGSEAFGFISDVLNHTQMDLVAEITDPRQVEILDPHIAMYQVGSRNMHNYSLLKELGKTQKPVMIKRGFSAFISEWIKSADYVVQGGNDRVILCERGIRTFENATRNTLDLNAVVYAKANCSFPVIVDPSHAIGERKYVPQLSMAAAAAGADGVIIEVHPRPAEALSDGPQALTIADFKWTMTHVRKILNAIGRPINSLDN